VIDAAALELPCDLGDGCHGRGTQQACLP
jgi:hypothetical protein